jgi:hypothetical protein
MGDPANKKAVIPSGGVQFLKSYGTIKVSFKAYSFYNQRSLIVTPLDGKNLADFSKKWVYAYYVRSKDEYILHAEVFINSGTSYEVVYDPNMSKARAERRQKVITNKGYIDLDESEGRRQGGGYYFVASPVAMTKKALDKLMEKRTILYNLGDHVVNDYKNDPPVIFEVKDPFDVAVDVHADYLGKLDAWEAFIGDEKRQARLFIASTLKNWIGDDGKDPADLKRMLKKGEPDREINSYINSEKTHRTAAERAMEHFAYEVSYPEFEAVEQSALDGGNYGIAMLMILWGICSEGMCHTAPGRALAYNLVSDKNNFLSTVIFPEQPKDWGMIFGDFADTWAASLEVVGELLPAKIKKLMDAAKSGTFSSTQKVQMYLKNLSIETTLQGDSRLIHERLEKGQRMTAGLKKGKRAKVINSFKKLVKKADAVMPDYTIQAKKQLDLAQKYHGAKTNIDYIGKSIGFILYTANFISAIEDFWNSYPDTKDQKLLSVIGAGSDIFALASGVAEAYMQKRTALKAAKALGMLGGAASAVSGVIDMLERMEKSVHSAMKTKDYGKAVGMGISAVGAATTAFAGGIVLVKALSGGALFSEAIVCGMTLGTVAGIIGVVLMLAGSLLVAWLSRSKYQEFAEHCFLGDDYGDEIHPDWSSVKFGGKGSYMQQIAALYDLIIMFNVEVVTAVLERPGLPYNTYESNGFRIKITPGLFDQDTCKFIVSLQVDAYNIWNDLYLKHDNLVLPFQGAGCVVEKDQNGRVSLITHTWTRDHKNYKKLIPRNSYDYKFNYDYKVTLQYSGRDFMGRRQSLERTVKQKGNFSGRGQYDKTMQNVDIERAR